MKNPFPVPQINCGTDTRGRKNAEPRGTGTTSLLETVQVLNQYNLSDHIFALIRRSSVSTFKYPDVVKS